MSTWIIWAFLLMAQNFAFVLVSRARQTKSLIFHGLASIPSNGIWFISQFVLVDKITKSLSTYNWKGAITIGLFYTFFTITGSLLSHHLSMTYFEAWFKGGKE